MLSPSELKVIAKAIRADMKKSKFRFFIIFIIVFAILLIIYFLVRNIPVLRFIYEAFIDALAG